MPQQLQTRRLFLRTGAAMAAGSLLVPASAEVNVKETPPVEDMMREHSVLRRALLAYQHCAQRIRDGKNVNELARPLYDTAYLFRKFGEDYHERALEEKHVFPAIMKSKGPVSDYPAVLTEQHERGRDMTALVMNLTHNGSIPSGSVQTLPKLLDEFILMYQYHAAYEDTVVYPAWKKAISEKEYNDMQQLFEDTEKRMLGNDGFETQLQKMADIEKRLGIDSLNQFTMPRIKSY